MRTLVIDTATRVCSVALFNGVECVTFVYEDIGRGHAEKLLPFIAGLPNKGRADQICVNTGPGSFTGIRVGIAAAKALSFAWGASCSGYNCLSLIAAMAKQTEPVDAVMNGGHGEYFFQSFDAAGHAAQEPRSLSPENAVAISSASYIAGDVSEDFVALRGNGVAIQILPDARHWPEIAALPVLLPSPFYGREADAKPTKVVAA